MILSTSNDFETRRTVWDSHVPVEFVMENSDYISGAQKSHFLMLPRVSYFPAYLDKPLRILTGNRVSDKELANAWIQHNGKPFKWHYPIGILYDIFIRNQTVHWTITICLKDFPDEIIRCRSKDALKFCFLQSLKEACQLKYQHNVVASMSKDEHSKFFDSLSNDRFNDFWMVNERMKQLGSTFSAGDHGITNLPVKFYESTNPFRQLLITTRKKIEDGTFVDTLLGDALKLAFPDYSIENDYEAVTHGIIIPLETPMIWLAINLSYPDNFVHIVLRLKDNK